jgi:hypothetical protein
LQRSEHEFSLPAAASSACARPSRRCKAASSRAVALPRDAANAAPEHPEAERCLAEF